MHVKRCIMYVSIENMITAGNVINIHTEATSMKKKLSCRKDTVRLLRGSVVAKCNWETIFCGHYRFIFHHCDVISLQGYRIR